MDELREKYQVPKPLSEPWIRQQQLILLLDGLDEVKEDYRNDCIRALNKYIELFPQTEMAVCSRVQDYESLTERLEISSAFCLQPLSSEQVYRFLDSVGGSLVGLKTLLKREAELEQFAQNPLILNFMSVAYQGGSVEELTAQLRSTSDRDQNLFDTYIDRRLERGASSEYSKDKVLCWLSWLERQMVWEKQTIFLIEKMQPTWLQNRSEEKNYRIRAFLLPGLSFGLIYGLIGSLSYGLSNNLITGLLNGLSFGLLAGLLAVLPKVIMPLETLSWSWQTAKSRLGRELLVGVIYGLIAGVTGGLINGLIVQSSDKQSFGNNWLALGLIGALIFGLIFGLGAGLGSSEIERRTVPNQGIRTSLRNSLIIGPIGGLIGGTMFGLIKGWLFLLPTGLIFGLIFGLKYGGVACIQHFTLRQMLYQKGRIPWNYAKFLDFASERLLTKKVGGGYVFFHRMLLEHFARMNPSNSLPQEKVKLANLIP